MMTLGMICFWLCAASLIIAIALGRNFYVQLIAFCVVAVNEWLKALPPLDAPDEACEYCGRPPDSSEIGCEYCDVRSYSDMRGRI